MQKPRLRLEHSLFPKFQICGASAPEPEQTDTPNDQSGSAAKDTADTGSAGGSEKIRDPEAKVAALQEEKDRQFAARQKAESERDELRNKVDAAEREKLSKDERTAKDLEEAQSSLSKLQETNRGLALKIAFLTNDNTTTWHSSEAALRLADLSDVKVKEDGSIENPDALKAAIKKLATDNPYLVKTAEPPSGTTKTPPPASGQSPTGTPAKTDGLDTESLTKKYPALRGR